MDLQIALERRARVEEFRRKHRIGLLALLFSDIVGSTQLKQDWGDLEAVAMIQRHHALVRRILRDFEEAAEISTSGDSCFLVFTKPSDAVRFAVRLRSELCAEARQTGRAMFDRIGIHAGEVFIDESESAVKPKDLYGMQVDMCARIMSLGRENQVLMSRFAFDNARQVLKGQELEGIGALAWFNHGPYLLKGLDEPIEICEVGETHSPAPAPPGNSDQARQVSPPWARKAVVTFALVVLAISASLAIFEFGVSKYAAIEIETYPEEGAEVWVGARRLGITPCRADHLKPGEMHCTLRLTNYEACETRFKIVPGRNKFIAVLAATRLAAANQAGLPPNPALSTAAAQEKSFVPPAAPSPQNPSVAYAPASGDGDRPAGKTGAVPLSTAVVAATVRSSSSVNTNVFFFERAAVSAKLEEGKVLIRGVPRVVSLEGEVEVFKQGGAGWEPVTF